MRRLVPLACLAMLMTAAPVHAETPSDIVRGFLEEVRSGNQPDSAERYLAPQVRAHQITAEGVTTVIRTPQNYADHVREFRRTFGNFRLELEELIANGDKVFVRWRQEGCHCGSVAGESPTGKPLTEITSVVYRVSGSRIVEYWLQTDRKGLEVQLKRRR